MGGTLSRVLIRHGRGVVGRKAIKDTIRLYHDLMQSGFFNYCAMAKNAEVPGRE